MLLERRAVADTRLAEINQAAATTGWETRGGPKKLLYSQLMCWVAIERAIRLATRRGLPADLERWRKARDTIYRRIMDRGWSPTG